MKRYNPKMFVKDPVTKEISMFVDYKVKPEYSKVEHVRVMMFEDPAGEWVHYKDVERQSAGIRGCNGM